jgi:ABC-2 type transport system permease protein
MLVSLLAVVRKEFRQAFRDKRVAFMLMAAPVIQLTLLGYAVDLEVDRIPTVICDQDHTARSRDLGAAFVAEGTFRKVATVRDPREAQRMLEDSRAAAALIIPVGFGRDYARQKPIDVQVLVDGSDPNRAQVAMNTAAMFLAERAVGVSLQRVNQAFAAMGAVRSLPQQRLVPRVLYNPRLKSAIFMVPGVAVMVLLVVTTIVTAMGIARERELGTMEQIMVTPLRPAVLLLGKCLPFAIIGLIDVGTLLCVGSFLFGVPLHGSLLVVFAAALLFLFSTLGVGIFISTVSRSQQQAILGGFFFLMPAILLGGFMTPIDNMPGWIRPLTYLDPVRYFLEILRGCLLKGSGFADLWRQFLALAIFGVSIMTLSVLRFRNRIA